MFNLHQKSNCKLIHRGAQLITLILVITVIAGCSTSTKSKFDSSIEKKQENTLTKVKPIPEEALNCKFGTDGVDNNYRKRLEIAKKNKMLWDRSHPGFANWQQIEPSEGDYRWGAIDEYVRITQEADIQILFTIWPYTNWDQESCNSNLKWMSNDWGKNKRDFLELANRMGKPCDMEAYKVFLKKLIERYDGDGIDDMPELKYPIKYWEMETNRMERPFFREVFKTISKY